jgi:hypothetical protein
MVIIGGTVALVSECYIRFGWLIALISIVPSIFIFNLIGGFPSKISELRIKKEFRKYSDHELAQMITIDNWIKLPFILREMRYRRKDINIYKDKILEMAQLAKISPHYDYYYLKRIIKFFYGLDIDDDLPV